MRIMHDMVKIISQAGWTAGRRRRIQLPGQIAAMWQSGMSATAIRRALGLNAEAALAAGIIAPAAMGVSCAARRQRRVSRVGPAPGRRPKAARRSGPSPGPGSHPRPSRPDPGLSPDRTAAREPARPRRSGPAMISVLTAVAQAANIPAAHLLGPSQQRDLVRPRQLVMYLVREMCEGATLPAIGHLFGRDHTTVLYGCRRAKDLLARDAGVRSWRDRALYLLERDPVTLQ